MEAVWRGWVGSTGDEDLAIGMNAVSLTIPSGFNTGNGRAVVTIRRAPVLFTLSKTAPQYENSGTGSPLAVGATLIVYGSEILNLRLVRAGVKNASVHVRYELRVA